MVLLFNSKLRLFPRKLRSRLLGPFKVTKVFPHGAIEVWSESIGLFMVNRWWFKPYVVGEPIEKDAVHTLTDSMQA